MSEDNKDSKDGDKSKSTFDEYTRKDCPICDVVQVPTTRDEYVVYGMTMMDMIGAKILSEKLCNFHANWCFAYQEMILTRYEQDLKDREELEKEAVVNTAPPKGMN